MTQLAYQVLAAMRVEQVAWAMSARKLRILCYHGVCRDEVVAEPWVPSYFVSQSRFERQLRYLRRHATVLPLSEAIARLKNDSLPRRAVSLTFDDGYANNVELAAPLLRRFDMRATVFLSTAYVESGDYYPVIRLKLVRLARKDARLPDYKRTPVDDLNAALAAHWPAVETALSTVQRETLRPMTVDEVRSEIGGALEFGAHSHSHGIARNESTARRVHEVRTSLRKVREWTGQSSCCFSYPNGQDGDFGEPELAALRQEGVAAAVTGMIGINGRGADLLRLRRLPVTKQHDDVRFAAEVSGVRSWMLAVAGRAA